MFRAFVQLKAVQTFLNLLNAWYCTQGASSQEDSEKRAEAAQKAQYPVSRADNMANPGDHGDLAFALPVLVTAGVSGSTSRTRLLWSIIVRLPLAPQERPRRDRVHDQPPSTIEATRALRIVCADRKEVRF